MMATRHSTVVGGSSAERMLNCPASLPTTIALPATVDRASDYAEEGTHLHHVMDALMGARQKNNKTDLYTLASSFVGRKFHDRELTTELLASAIEPALDQLAVLEKHYGGHFRVVGVEAEVTFPGVPGAFGTADVLLQSRRFLIVLDWKFGAGVQVAACYQLDDGSELINTQLGFYTTAAFATLPELFKDRGIVGAIIQPRGANQLSHTKIAPIELKMFAQDIERSIVEALSPNPHREKGEWCRWAPCKLTCPLWTGPALDLSMLQPLKRQANDAMIRKPTAYGEYLAAAKALIDQLLILKPEIDEQIHAFLADGGIVPGWKLKAKVKNRQWLDEKTVVPELKKLGFADNDIWQKKLQTFTVADAAAKRLHVTIPDYLRVAPPSNETTIAASDDPEPAVEIAQAVKNFQTALKKLTER